MEERLKNRVIRTLSDKLMDLIEALETKSMVDAKELQQVFDLFQKLEDMLPRDGNEEMVDEHDMAILNCYVIRMAPEMGFAHTEASRKMAAQYGVGYYEELYSSKNRAN